jgi:hypothetical protein
MGRYGALWGTVGRKLVPPIKPFAAAAVNSKAEGGRKNEEGASHFLERGQTCGKVFL